MRFVTHAASQTSPLLPRALLLTYQRGVNAVVWIEVTIDDREFDPKTPENLV